MLTAISAGISILHYGIIAALVDLLFLLTADIERQVRLASALVLRVIMLSVILIGRLISGVSASISLVVRQHI